MKFHWQRAKKRSRKVLLMMKKVMSQLLCLQRETTSVRDVIEMPSINTTDVLANGTQSIPGTGEDISEDNHKNEGSYDLVSGTKKQTDGSNEIVPQVQGADVGNELCVEEIGKECANVTTDTTEQRVGDDVKSSCAGRCNHTQNDDSAIDNKDSTNECETKFICQSFNNCGFNACVKEATNNAVINDNYQIRDENEGSSEDSDLLKKASEIASFRKLHSDVEEKLTNLCHVWEQKSPILSIPEDRKEEVLGQIRTTVCQAQLLMRQKLKQYIGLVGQTEHGGGEQPTKVEDLQGFWDMVYFQVEEMMKKFQELEDLEKNNWKVEETLEPAAKKRKKCAIPPPAAMESKSSLSEKQLAAREKREAARLKIKELKAMAVTKKSQDDEQSTPSCADKIESLSDAVKSANAVPSSPLAPLMDFDTPAPSHPTPKHVKSTPRPPAPLSPESSLLSPLPAALLRTPKKAVDVPTAQLLSLTPARATPATPGKMESCEGAFKKMYVAVTPSKKLRDAHPELTGDDVVMSEARRSVRLAHKGSCTPRHQVVVSSLAELPDDIDFSYCPPSQL